MILAQLRDKADAALTTLWQTVQEREAAYYARNNAYRAVSIRKLHTPYDNRFDAWARVVADDTGYSLQVLVEYDGTQYARAQGHGTGQTFGWKVVNVGDLGTDEGFGSPPNSLSTEEGISYGF